MSQGEYMIVLGVMGGVGAGKSTVLDCLQRRYGALLIKLDDLGKQVLAPGTSGYEKTVQLFGRDIVTEDGSLDRKKMASLVFTDEKLRQALDYIVHPAVREMTLRILEGERAAEASARDGKQGLGKNGGGQSGIGMPGERLCVIESAILVEAHYDALCDEVWYIYADEKTREERLRMSRGYSSRRSRAVMDSQMTDAEFRAHADRVIDNSGSPEQTEAEIGQCMEALVSARKGIE